MERIFHALDEGGEFFWTFYGFEEICAKKTDEGWNVQLWRGAGIFRTHREIDCANYKITIFEGGERKDYSPSKGWSKE